MALPARKIDYQRLYTVEEFEELPEFGDSRYELIDGKLVKRAMPGHEHGWIIDLIRDAIKFFDPKRQLGYSLQEVSVDLGQNTAPTPDISYWTAARAPKVTKKAAPQPDLAVEILSPSDTASREALNSAMIKVYRLLNVGVTVVWVVNPARKIVEVYHAGQSHPVQVLDETGVLNGETIIPGFTLPVKELFQ